MEKVSPKPKAEEKLMAKMPKQPSIPPPKQLKKIEERPAPKPKQLSAQRKHKLGLAVSSSSSKGPLKNAKPEQPEAKDAAEDAPDDDDEEGEGGGCRGDAHGHGD